ncbi:MAG TPA: hypothetical protein VEU52_06040, partial [Candidatus Limnocylindrales bacterium]|nr:hypothetical protein [Candidatus Limnocylindrales bacterium]
MLGKILTLAAGFGLTVLLEVASATAQTYRNDEFGITLPVPKGLFLCPNPPDEHDHGPVLLFDPARANTCNDAQGGRFIGVFASYNAADVTKTLGKFLKWLCSEGGKRSCLPTPPNLEIPG